MTGATLISALSGRSGGIGKRSSRANAALIVRLCGMLQCFVHFDDLLGGGVMVTALPDSAGFSVYVAANHDGDGVAGCLLLCVFVAYNVGEMYGVCQSRGDRVVQM